MRAFSLIFILFVFTACNKEPINAIKLPVQDTLGPTITVIYPDTSPVIKTKFDFTFKALLFDTSVVDSFGIDLYRIGDSNRIYYSNGRANEKIYLLESRIWRRRQVVGNYIVTFYARDKLGNVSQKVKYFGATVFDNTPPGFHELYVGNPRRGLSFYNHTNQILFNVYDRHTGVKRLDLRIVNDKTQMLIYSDTFIVGSTEHPYPQHEAINYNFGSNPNPGKEINAKLTLSATDNWNNSASRSLSITIKDQ